MHIDFTATVYCLHSITCRLMLLWSHLEKLVRTFPELSSSIILSVPVLLIYLHSLLRD